MELHGILDALVKISLVVPNLDYDILWPTEGHLTETLMKN